MDVLREALGPDSVCFLIDHPDQLSNLIPDGDDDMSKCQVPVFVKIDSGYHRAGLTPGSREFESLLRAILRSIHCKLVGFYSHNSHSYGVDSPEQALDYLVERELDCGAAAVEIARKTGWEKTRFNVSIGATPSVSAAQNLLANSGAAVKMKTRLKERQKLFDLELHAGVYTLLDLQQIATHARPASSKQVPTMGIDDIGLRVLAEVLSVYKGRDKPEALVGAGSLALGREPCKSYPGWAIVSRSPWNDQNERRNGMTFPLYSEEERTGWIVDRVSQEHGILTWQDENREVSHGQVWYLQVGEKVPLLPNHACITSAGFDFYLVVDSESNVVDESTIVDVWVRARGW